MRNDRNDKGPDSGLSEALGAEDLAIFNEVLAALFSDLRDASTLYRDKKISDRAATVIALGAAYRFLMCFRPALDEQLHLPLLNLSSALMALNDNYVAPLLRPTRTPIGGRAPDPPKRQALIGLAVGTVGRLVWTGMPVREACKVVAAELVRLGIGLARGTGTIKDRTVKGWCDRVSADRPAIRAILTGGAKAVTEADPGDVAASAAVINADEMLTPKWRSLIERQPRKEARAFVLSCLKANITNMWLDRLLIPPTKSANPPS